MSTLHERLLDVAENGHPGDGVDDHEPRLYATVRAVVERHKPTPCTVCSVCRQPQHRVCEACGPAYTYPRDCADTMAIAEALGVEVDDE